MHLSHAVLAGNEKAFGKIVAGDYLALLLRFGQKFPGALGSGGIVHIKNTHNAAGPYRHIIAYG